MEEPRIVIRVEGEDFNLRPEGFSARVVRNATLLYPSKDATLDALQGLQYTALLEVVEQGGGATNTGNAVVYCRPDGKPMKPYRFGSYSNGSHAFFSSRPPVIEVKASRWRGNEKVSIARVLVDGLEVVYEPVWDGRPDELPNALAHLHDAVEAALQKAYDYHCRRAYFYAEQQK